MLVLLHAEQRLEVGPEERLPVVEADVYCLLVLRAHELRHVDAAGRARLCQARDVVEAGDAGAAVALLEQTEAPVWSELRVAGHHEVQTDAPVQPMQRPPDEVEEHVSANRQMIQ